VTELVALALLCPIVVTAAVSDLRSLRISNRICLIGMLIACAALPLLPLPEIGLRIAAASLLFVAGFLAFALNLVGAGDVKLMSVLMLTIPSASWQVFAIVMCAALITGLAGVVAWQNLPRLQSVNWRASVEPGQFPMGVSIALAAVMHLVVLTPMVI